MSDDALSLREDTPGQAVDEQRIAKGVAIGLPLVTVSVAAVVGILVGPATSILVLAAGLLLGVIAILWGSLRILSGDAALSPELEALDMAAQGVDALASRKKMLLRALKDLENERSIGKIEDEDYEQISSTYREELKLVLKRIDESLAPHRAKAEEAARAHLRKAGLAETGYRGEQPAATGKEPGKPTREAKTTTPETSAAKARIECPKCGQLNERDAKFCKECATKLSGGTTKKEAIADAKDASSETEDSDDE